jgi:carboxymethylenebutenolidase
MPHEISTSASEFSFGNDSIAVYVARPTGGGPFPGLMVFHEAFGLNDDIRRIADRFATNGYVTVAPDLIGGGFGCLVKVFRDLARGSGHAYNKARASIDFLADQADVDDDRLGLVGFCMGGDFALALGIDERIKVTAPNYGKAPDDAHIEKLCPVVASYGNKDKVFRGNAARLETVLTAAGIDNDIKLYPDAGHSFINTYAPWYTAITGPVMAVGYCHDEAEDAWMRMLAFFETQLTVTS